MQKVPGGYRYAPTDLVEFFDSTFAAWMSRFALDFPDRVQPDPDPSELATLAEQGQRHEQTLLAQFQTEGRTVYAVPSVGDHLTLTRAAMEAGREIIYQAALAHGEWGGAADFLVRVAGTSALGPYHYEVWDAKLARLARPAFLLQLCCYADLLEALQGQRPTRLHLVLGDGQPVPFRTEDYFYYYRFLKSAFLTTMRDFDPAHPPEPDLGGTYGCWTSHAHARLRASDHLSRVATITTEQICKLEAAGVQTMTALAESTCTHVARLDDLVLARLREQARLQLASVTTAHPAYRLLTPDPQEPRRGLALLPPASPADVYFDMEGYPLTEEGLEYLFGVTFVEANTPQYQDWWAHDRVEERQAFAGWVDWVYARWQADPTMHIYHYATYEVTAVRKLMGQHGTCEAEVDALLRNDIFVDLYPIVRQGLCVGTPDYSLKSLERLYRPPRVGDVATAGDSMVYYDRWLASGEARRWQDSSLLRAIRDYNREDCESTWQLTEWLRARQGEAGVAWLPRPGKAHPDLTDGEEPTAPKSPQQELAETLLAQIPDSAVLPPEQAEH